MDSTALSVILILAGLNVVQFFFWGLQLQKLVDKVMSRNFAEYVQVQAQQPKKQVKIDNEPNDDLGILDGIGIPT